ncbi:Bug family tripartite tricarboxylate transporter substrate binding protein [Bordetella petrii]|uniref:Secreted protein n=1 Tax=Bordetella petrii (strain ATCC BAA-461 / DSM 12804 / CCUG 43448 / CIP 107267 / Se-1111R) TaxID=340100 RepID=A9IDD1_BORPD|nr:tripartite tricarboxylate transporter substrate binding protein [Bordetella petrii]CAP44803.1 putative secreted protein [Bordetella petrii]
MRHTRKMLQAAALACLLGQFALPATAAAQGYPDKPITMLVPYPAGQSVDLLARVISDGLSKVLGQPIIVENKPGAGGTLGTGLVARAAPDGYTLGMSSSGPLGIAPHLFKNTNYDPVKDFTAIMNVAAVAQTMVVSAKSDITSVQDLVAAAKAKPNKLNFGSPGNGSTSHLTQEMFKQRAHVQMLHVPYKGGPAAITDLIGGQIDVLFEASPTVTPFINRGDLRALAVTTRAPIPALPQVKPLASQGYENFEAVGWMGIVGPAHMKPEVVRTLHAALVKTLQDPAVRQKLDTQGMLTVGDTPEQFAAFIKSESEKWGSVIRSADIKVQ